MSGGIIIIGGTVTFIVAECDARRKAGRVTLIFRASVKEYIVPMSIANLGIAAALSQPVCAVVDEGVCSGHFCSSG